MHVRIQKKTNTNIINAFNIDNNIKANTIIIIIDANTYLRIDNPPAPLVGAHGCGIKGFKASSPQVFTI